MSIRRVTITAIAGVLVTVAVAGCGDTKGGDDKVQAYWDGLDPVARNAMCDAPITPSGENFYGPAKAIAAETGVDMYAAQDFLLDTATAPYSQQPAGCLVRTSLNPTTRTTGHRGASPCPADA